MAIKTKFDDNVAQNIPITKNSAEPELPWKLSDSEINSIEANDENYKATITAPPLQVRAVFMVFLVVAIFAVILNSIVGVVMDNTEMQSDILNKEKQVSSIQAALEKTSLEKAALNDTAAKLEKRVNDLNTQKELYSAVIETLTKKTDDSPIN
ncbi:MAG: hypothetical protein KKH77_02005 [Candidatus Omnitrophica bacterium]|nr:hypothetical protein [Candidatus Omnitrophota bacterium]MBU0880883.1 hypothetical protein [Candidatus Omnitrophota bacterium]MBU0895147.1 hypothetical protein [Candidatus Omnitrophota bacterium]MBU1037572.1 hypothetical protein [Candidatus Omnitrophota bacterium]MBU1808685.1 hypothetical protein [Candidatus Omnitrophota bacterium]